MPPQNYGQSSPHGSDPYDFIMSAGQKRGGPLFSGSGISRLLIITAGAFVLIVALWIFLSIVRRSPHADSAALLTIVQKQTELARISDETRGMTNDQSTLNFALTTELNLLTEQQFFTTYIAKHGIKLTKEALHTTQSDQTDAQLKNAQINGNFDQVFNDTAKMQLTSYERALSDTYKIAQLNSEKKLLQRAYNEAQTLEEFEK
jgi:hypothetical protein